MPPQIHRRIFMTMGPNGLIIIPKAEEESAPPIGTHRRGASIGWGVKGRVEHWEGAVQREHDQWVEIGGILGLVRLWDGE